jgi:hypothetical protein
MTLGHSEVMITKRLRIRVSVTEFQNDVLKINYFDKLLNDALLGHSEVMATKRLRIRVSVTEFQNSILCFSAVAQVFNQQSLTVCICSYSLDRPEFLLDFCHIQVLLSILTCWVNIDYHYRIETS